MTSVPQTSFGNEFAVSKLFDPADRAEVRAIFQGRDSECTARDLLNFGRRKLNNRQENQAAFVFQALAEGEMSQEVARRARTELDALLGQGRVGMRWEYLAGRFARDVADYRNLFPMLAAGLVGELAGAATLARIGGVGRGAFSTRVLTGGAALLAETPVFIGLHRALATEASGPLAPEVSSAALNLGAMKIFAAIGKTSVRFLPQRLALLRPVLPQASLFFGLLGAQRAEEILGLRTARPGTTSITDALAAMLGMQVGGRLGHRLLGTRLDGLRRTLQLHEILRAELPRLRRPELLRSGLFSFYGWQASASSGSSPLTPQAQYFFGISALALAGFGIYRLFRWVRGMEPKPGEYYYRPSADERWLLREFFFLERVPEKITWSAWLRVQKKVLRAARLVSREEARYIPRTYRSIEIQRLALKIISEKELHDLRRNNPSNIAVDPFPNPKKNQDPPKNQK